jgi:hypothetical protein
MIFKGGSIKGARYGQTNPKDYLGLEGWWKATDGINIYRGNNVASWADQSGKGRTLVATNNLNVLQNSSGLLANTSWGLALSNFIGSSRLSAIGKGAWHKFLIDGSPYTIIAVCRSASASLASLNIGNNNAGSLGGTASISINSQANSNLPIRITNHTSLDYFGYLTANQNSVYNLTGYGYNNGVTPDAKFSINAILRTSGNYTSSPITLTHSDVLSITTAGFVYEVIIYNHTGKTQTQIDFEMSNLYNNYIKMRYKNFV